MYVQSTASQSVARGTSGSPQDSDEVKKNMRWKRTHEVKIIYLLHRVGIFTNGAKAMLSKTVDYLAEIKANWPNYWLVILFFTAIYSQEEKKKASFFKNVPEEVVNIFNFMKFWSLSTYLLNLPFDKMGNMHKVLISRRSICVVIWVASWNSCFLIFYHRTHFSLEKNDWQITNYSYSDFLVYGRYS